jgi:hypothetical protein
VVRFSAPIANAVAHAVGQTPLPLPAPAPVPGARAGARGLTPSAAGSTRTPNAADLQVAQAAALTAADVPADFATQPPLPGTSTFDGRACRTMRDAVKALDTTAHAESAFITADGHASIDNSAAVFPTVRRADKAYRAYASPNTAACLQAAVQKSVTAAVNDPAATVSVTVADDPLAVGDASAAHTVTATVTTPSGTATNSLVVATVRKGRGVAQFVFANAGSPPPSAPVLAMTQAVATRMPAAVG